GAHCVRMCIAVPGPNQFVRLGFSGNSEGVTNSIWPESFAEAASQNRFFYSATDGQPLRFSWTGPALLRLAEWRGGRFFRQVSFVPPGEQTVDIRPAAGRTES